MKTIHTVVLTVCSVLIPIQVNAQANRIQCDPSLNLVNLPHANAKSRLQDGWAPQTEHLVRLGKTAIPMLINCWTDETQTKTPIEDYWPATTVGDIAFFYLTDFFTDSSWTHSTVKGLIDWKTVQAAFPNQAAFSAWYRFIKKHGKKYVQNIGSQKWKEIQASAYWDDKDLCFRVREGTSN